MHACSARSFYSVHYCRNIAEHSFLLSFSRKVAISQLLRYVQQLLLATLLPCKVCWRLTRVAKICNIAIFERSGGRRSGELRRRGWGQPHLRRDCREVASVVVLCPGGLTSSRPANVLVCREQRGADDALVRCERATTKALARGGRGVAADKEVGRPVPLILLRMMSLSVQIFIFSLLNSFKYFSSSKHSTSPHS